MLNQHFGLSANPFQGSSVSAALYLGRAHREVLATLEWGLSEPSGFTLVTGETGTGKTTLIYSLLARSHPEVRIVHLSDPKLGFREMLGLVLAELNIRTRFSRLALVQGFNQALANLAPDRRLVLLLDEAQGLSDQTLEDLRLLANLPAATRTPLQLILVGQPELAARLRQPQLRQFNERIGARAQLSRLERREVAPYVDCRLGAVGGKATTIFSPSALRQLARHSEGLPRRINVLCHNAMLLAYVANQRRVGGGMVRAAAREYGGWLSARAGGSAPAPARPRLRRMGPLAAALMLGLAAWQGWEHGAPHSPARPARGGMPAARLVRNSAPRPLVTAMAPAAIAAGPGPMAQAHDSQRAPLAALPIPSVVSSLPAHRQIVIHPGDTVGALALQYLGSNAQQTLAQVARVNPQITDINRVFPGETMILPAVGGPSR
ncbi:MAG TPA: ATPase, T2SS/T4P/T4SS family [Candidatus Binataceae bacterium]|nr:ATPase, T2SS/T4P/T4SS family [Candidatus Binataceae bacterium]